MTAMSQARIARDISYAHSAATRGGRALIRMMENLTGRPHLLRRARGYEADIASGRDFWQVMVERYGLSLDIAAGGLHAIPREGPLVLVANHPFGILDGLMMGHILAQVRGDFRIMAHEVFRRAPDIERFILPISFDETRDGIARNLATRRAALDYLGQGGAIGIFPGGTVSTGATPMARPMDPSWRAFTARMVARSDASVVPVYFDGHNSRLFQWLSHAHPTLRMGLLIQQFRRRIGQPVRVCIGQPIARAEIAARSGDARALMDFLRRATYELSPEPLADYGYGFEFEEKHRA